MISITHESFIHLYTFQRLCKVHVIYYTADTRRVNHQTRVLHCTLIISTVAVEGTPGGRGIVAVVGKGNPGVEVPGQDKVAGPGHHLGVVSDMEVDLGLLGNL